MSEALATWEPKGISTNEGGSSDWFPIPTGNKYIFTIDNVSLKLPTGLPRLGTDGKPQKQYPRAHYRINLIEAQIEKLKVFTASKRDPGQEQSTSVWASFNYTWGFLRDGQLQVTKLFTFCANAGGFLVTDDMKAWVLNGGRLDPDWFKGMVFRGAVSHVPKQTGGGVWVNVEPILSDEHNNENRELLAGRLDREDSELFAKIQNGTTGTDTDLPF